MSAPHDKRGKRPAPIQIPVASREESEPMVIGTPIEPTASATFPEPRSFSSYIQTVRRRVAEHIQLLLRRPIRGSEAPGTSRLLDSKRFEVVRTEPRIRPTALLSEGDADNAEVELASGITHLNSLFIRDDQCFLVSSEKALRQPSLLHKLGPCVRFVEPECSKPWCNKCLVCGVCPHMYKCNCKVKYWVTEWCAHLHVMHEKTKGKFQIEALMFFQDNYRFTEMRHLRAFIQGRRKMRPSKSEEDVWKEKFEFLVRSRCYQLCPLPDAPCVCPANKKCELCGACLCKYFCTCVDNRLQSHVCEHIHNVAMQMHERRDELFRTFTEFGSGYPHTEGKEEDNNLRYYLEQEHEMSANFDPDSIVKQMTQPQKWHIRLGEHQDSRVVIVKENTFKDRPCYCSTAKATNANYCERCGICENHYTCDCNASQFTICQHMHAVALKEKERNKTPKQQFDDMLKLVIKKLDAEEDVSQFETRTPKELKDPNRPPESAHKIAQGLDSFFKFHISTETEL